MVDGDKSLVVADKKVIELAERNMKGIVPLFYNMKKAEAKPITPDNLYDGLVAAFTGGNIGLYSNDISKIYNSEVMLNGSDEKKEEALRVVKLLCAENNYVIDYAKTLYKPNRPKAEDELIKSFTKHKLPHFFTYAKDKEEGQVEEVNESFVNRLEKVIPNVKLDFKKVAIEKLDYKKMITKGYKRIVNPPTINSLIKRYKKMNNDFRNLSVNEEDKTNSMHMTSVIRAELSLNLMSDEEVCNELVEYLYGKTNSKGKELLWKCYGDLILRNLEGNLNMREIRCVDCGIEFYVKKSDSKTCRCDSCKNKNLPYD